MAERDQHNWNKPGGNVAKIISLFNHKGGVSKTTTAFNLGWMLAEKGQRVLLVDADSQCNLTGMVLGFKGLADLDGLVGGDVPKNIRDGLAPAFESRPSPIVGVDCQTVPGNDKLFLLPGNIRLAEYEVTLGIAQELSSSLMTLRNLPGSLRFLIDITSEKYKIDLVLIDLSPSLGPINQNLTMVSDFILVPMNPDYFSSMAIDSLASVLPKWKTWADRARSNPVLTDADYPFPSVQPKFLGAVIQKYRPRVGNVPAQAFQKWIDDLCAGIKDKLLPALERSEMLFPKATYDLAGFNPADPILQMPDFNSLIARSQEHQVPVYGLSDQQLAQVGNVLENSKESMIRFRGLFEDAAKRITAMIEDAKSN